MRYAKLLGQSFPNVTEDSPAPAAFPPPSGPLHLRLPVSEDNATPGMAEGSISDAVLGAWLRWLCRSRLKSGLALTWASWPDNSGGLGSISQVDFRWKRQSEELQPITLLVAAF